MLGTCGFSVGMDWDVVVILEIVETRVSVDCLGWMKVPWRESVERSVAVCRAFVISHVCLFLVFGLRENVLLDDSVMSPGYAGRRRANGVESARS